MKILNFFPKVCGLALPLFLSAGALSAQDWTRISYVDFGGNSIEDPQFRVTPLTEEEGSTSLVFSAGPTRTQKYMLLKHFGAQRPENWSIGGDHTNNENTELGYFMAIDCPPSKNYAYDDFDEGYLDYPKDAIYSKELTNVEEGMTFRFSAAFAKLSLRDASRAGSKLALGVLDREGNVLWQSPSAIAFNSDTESLNWCILSSEFTSPVSADTLFFKIYPVQGNYPGAEQNGFDFALDDISIEMKTLKGKVLLQKNLILCEGESVNFLGETFDSDRTHYLEDSTYSYEVLSHVVVPQQLEDKILLGCPNIPVADSDSLVFNAVGDYAVDPIIERPFISCASGNHCISTIQNVLVRIREEHIIDTIAEYVCQGELHAKTGKVFDTVGLTEPEIVRNECFTTIYNLNVLPTYVGLDVVDTICANEYFRREKYEPGDYELPNVHFYTHKGCDSIANVKLHVSPTIKTELPGKYFCQGEFGKGKTVFNFGGIDYRNDTNDLYSFTASEFIPKGAANGFDSITEINVVILPIEELTLDTMICKGDSLFGQYWNESGLFLKKMSMPIEMSRFGCPGNSLSYHVKVSDVNLKIRAAHNNNEIEKGQSVELLANSIGDIVNLTWGHNESLHDAEIIVTPENTTTYMAVVVDDIGCTATDSITIVVLADTIAATELIDAEVFDAPVNIYSINGALLKNNVILKEVAATLPDGLYIVGNKKVYIRRK